MKQGDLLVSGQIPIYNDAKEITSYQYCISDADIYGKTTVQYEKEMKRNELKKFEISHQEDSFSQRIITKIINNVHPIIGIIKLTIQIYGYI